MTPAEIIYHRRVRLLALADELGNVVGGVPPDGHLPDPLLRVARIVARVRARGVDAQGPAHAAAAQRHPDPRRRGPVDVGRGRADDRLPPVRRPARRTRLPRSPRRRCRSCSSPTAWVAEPSASLGPQRSPRPPPGCPPRRPVTAEPFGFCHYSPAPGCQVAIDSFYIGNLKGVGKVYQLTAIDVATRWAIMPIVLGPHRRAHDPLHRPRPAPLAASRRVACAPCSPTTDPSRSPAGSAPTSPPESIDHHADPATLTEPQRRVRTLPRHRPAGMLAARVPPPPLQLDPPTASRSRRLADPLPPPPPQPQRLHARPHTRRNPRQPPSPPSIMTTSHRDHHLSPQPPARKP